MIIFTRFRFSLLFFLLLFTFSSCNILEKFKKEESIDLSGPTEFEILSAKNDYLLNKIKYLTIRHNHPKAIKEDNFDTFWVEMTSVSAEKFSNQVVITYEMTNLGKEKILGMSGYGQILKIGDDEIIGCGTTGSRFGCDRMAVYQKDVPFSSVVIGRQKFEVDDQVKQIDTLKLMCKVNGSNHHLAFANLPLEWH